VVAQGFGYSDPEMKNLSFVNTMNLFIRGIGGFESQPKKYKTYIKIPQLPKRNPDAVLKEKTREDQAVLYRLSGDDNPLHIDPEMAQMGNFDKPILHGLCSYGICAKKILRHFGNNVSANFKEISARFTSFVFPGETIVINVSL
jgi:acyl dehydratase